MKSMASETRPAKTRFKIGDMVVHPAYGAGILVDIEKQRRRGKDRLCYNIRMLTQPGTNLIVPLSVADTSGLRLAISKAKLEQVWRTLRTTPRSLPADHKQRYEMLMEKLHAGNVFTLVEIVRDLAWRQRDKGHLTERDQRVYQKGMTLLAGEVAAALGVDAEDAMLRVGERLRAGLELNAARLDGPVESPN